MTYLHRIVTAVVASVYLCACSGADAPTYVPHNPVLRSKSMYFYPSTNGSARAFVFFFGNDLAFWEPHQKLARRFANEGYDVVGLDIVPFLNHLPDGPGIRDSAVAHAVTETIARARAELHADSLPIVLMGHSFGAELAFWIAHVVPPPKLAGVLAMNPRPAGHLYIDAADWGNRIASGPRSFSVVQIAHDLPPDIRIALVRSGRDHFLAYDSTLVPSGGTRLHRFLVPFAKHALSGLLVAGPFIDRAMQWIGASHQPPVF